MTIPRLKLVDIFLLALKQAGKLFLRMLCNTPSMLQIVLKPLLTSLAFGLLCSCASQQQVHIFNLGYSSEEIELVASPLSEAGFSPRQNSLSVPEEIQQSSIIYPTIVQDFGKIETLRTELDWSPVSRATV